MSNNHSFNTLLQEAIVNNWSRDALTDYKGDTLQYHDVARKIEKIHIFFESVGLQHGDKVALCGRNSSMWGCAFLATLTYGAIAVPIQHEFTPDQVYTIVNHSEAKLLFVGDVVATSLNWDMMPNLAGVIYLPDNSVIVSRTEKLTYAREHLNEIFGEHYPMYFHKEHIHYHEDQPEEIAVINYTSGTTGFSKGVMLPYRSLWSNTDYIIRELGPHLAPHGNMLSILPMAHMYGLVIEFILSLVLGNHLYFLTRLPSPTIIQQAFADIKPNIIVSVPLIVEKIVRKAIFPKLDTPRMKLLLKMPGINKKVKESLCQKVMEIFGGNAYEIIIGGAGLNQDVEGFFRSINFPITVGYGTTETGPLISYTDWKTFSPSSCGKVVANMELRIQSSDPENIPGEILTRGLNVMKGYYKNPSATEAVIDKDGWFHTGDIGTLDKGGNLYIRGRLKNMLLGSNGQNVYPEEIEDKLNSMAMVNESIIIQHGDKLVGLVHPDMEEAHSLGFNDEDLANIMEQNRKELNTQLPSFCKLSEIKLQYEEFEKTPKRSIKRYLYQNAGN
jgi:long-chain acyl-CoA synthetase